MRTAKTSIGMDNASAGVSLTGCGKINCTGADKMGTYEAIYGVLLSSTYKGLKKKPALIAHALFSVFIGAFILSIIKWLIYNVLGCIVCVPNYYLLLSISLILLLLSLGVYIECWRKLENKIRELLPNIFDEVLGSWEEIADTILNRTIYDLIIDMVKQKNGSFIGESRDELLVLASYYMSWVFGLYSADLVLYIASGYRYTLFGYMLDNIFSIPAVLFASPVVALLVYHLSRSEEESGLSKNECGMNMQYLKNILDRFVMPRGLEKYIPGRLVSFFGILWSFVAVPVPIDFSKVFFMDLLQIPYLKSKGSQNSPKDMPADIIERMIRKDAVENYWLEPLKKECSKPPKTDVPSLRRACWYRVYRREGDKWVRVGYAMIIVVTRHVEESRLLREKFEDCIKVIRKKMVRNYADCYAVVEELAKMYLRDKDRDTAVIFLLGNEKIAGLRLRLQ